MQRFFKLLPVFLLVAIGVAWLFPLVALGTRFGLWQVATAFSLLGGAALTCAILLAISGVAILMAIARKDDKAKHRAALIAMVVLLPLSVVFYFGVKAGQVPEIHDISTDTVNPPALQALLEHRPASANPLNYTPDTAVAQAKAYPLVQPLLLAKPVDAVVLQAAQVAEALGWDVVAVDAVEGRVEATDTTFWFGFVDDIVIRVRPEAGQSRVDIRSVSRVGRSDIGKNAGRIQAFLEAMNTP